MKVQGHIPNSAPPGARETTEIDVRRVTRVGILLGVTLLFSLLSLVAIFRVLELRYQTRTSEAAPVVREEQLPPEPRVQVHPLRDLEQVRAAEEEHLSRYAWVDRSRGVAQIPIDRAMLLWVQASAATQPASASSAPVTELQMRQEKAQESTHVP